MLILKSFSAVKNFNEWLSVKTASVEEITCLHGLRVITLLLVLFVHTSELVFVHSRPIYQEKMLKVSFFKTNIYQNIYCTIFIIVNVALDTVPILQQRCPNAKLSSDGWYLDKHFVA